MVKIWQGMSEKKKRLLSGIGRAAISATLLTYVLLNTDLSQLWASVQVSNYWLIALGIPMFWVTWSLQAVRWYVLLKALGWEVSYGQVWTITQTSQFYSLFLPGKLGGELARWLKLSQQTQQTRTNVGLSIIVDRLVGLFAMSVLLVVGVFIYQGAIVTPPMRVIAVVMLLLMLVGGAAFIIGVRKVFPRWLQAWIERLGQRIKIVSQLWEGLVAYEGKAGALLLSLLWAVSVHVVHVLGRLVLANALGIHIALLDMLIVYVIVAMLTMIPVSMLGLGIREITYVQLLQFMGYSGPELTAIPLILFALVVLGALLLGGSIELFGGLSKIVNAWKPSNS